MVIVSHGHFMSELFKALLGIPFATTEPVVDGRETNRPLGQKVAFASPNTSSGLFEVQLDGKVVVHWIGDTAHLPIIPVQRFGSSVL